MDLCFYKISDNPVFLAIGLIWPTVAALCGISATDVPVENDCGKINKPWALTCERRLSRNAEVLAMHFGNFLSSLSHCFGLRCIICLWWRWTWLCVWECVSSTSFVVKAIKVSGSGSGASSVLSPPSGRTGMFSQGSNCKCLTSHFPWRSTDDKDNDVHIFQ